MKKEPFVSYENSLVKNFSLSQIPQASVAVHKKDCLGCQATNSEIMLTFGSEIMVLNGNNQPIVHEELKHVDVFLNKEQAQKLLKKLQEALSE